MLMRYLSLDLLKCDIDFDGKKTGNTYENYPSSKRDALLIGLPVRSDGQDAAILQPPDNCPDILDLSGLNIKQLAAKGVFEDLNGYLEKSEKLSREDFLENILEAYTL